MKKIIYIISVVSLLFLFSVSSFAVSNDYIFSNVWNKTSFLNSHILTNNTNYSAEVISAPLLNLDNGTDSIALGYTDSTFFSGIDFDAARSTSFDVSIPIGYYLNSYESFNYQMYLLLPGNYDLTVTSTAVLTNSSTVSVNTDTTHYDSGSLQSITYNSFGGIDSTSTIFDASDVYQIDLSLPGVSGNYDIDYIIVSFTLNSSASSFILGSLGSTDIVSLPESITYLLSSISKKINLTNERILQLINELKSTNGKIDDILSALASSSAGTTVLTQFLQTPTPEQQEVTQQLEQLLEEAQEELASVKDVLESVQTPTYNDIVSSNIDANQSVITVLSSPQLKDITDSIFDSFIYLTPVLLSVLAIATIGYILFGKRG